MELPSKPLPNYGRESIVLSPESSNGDSRSNNADTLKISKSQECIFAIQNIDGGRARIPISDNDSGGGAICLEDFGNTAEPISKESFSDSSGIGVVDEQESGLPEMQCYQ